MAEWWEDKKPVMGMRSNVPVRWDKAKPRTVPDYLRESARVEKAKHKAEVRLRAPGLKQAIAQQEKAEKLAKEEAERNARIRALNQKTREIEARKRLIRARGANLKTVIFGKSPKKKYKF